jgi:hypothetical protein
MSNDSEQDEHDEEVAILFMEMTKVINRLAMVQRGDPYLNGLLDRASKVLERLHKEIEESERPQ